MAYIKHNKIKNSGILFEILVRKITSDSLMGDDSKCIPLLKKYFVNTELGKEYKIYETVFKNTNISEAKAKIILDTVLEASKNINRTRLRKEKYNLIKELKENYNLDSLFRIKLDNYKKYAALYTLIEAKHKSADEINTDQIIDNKLTLLEGLTASPIDKEKVSSTLLEEYKSIDKETRILTYRILLEKFNDKYKDLSNDQKRILKEYISSVDSTSQLKEFYNKEINYLSKLLNKNSKGVTSQSTKIKLDEIKNLMTPLDKKSKVKEKDLVNLLQYHSLIQEIKLANEKVQV